MNHITTFTAALLIIGGLTGNAHAANDSIEVESVVLRLLQEAEVPAQESGVLTSVAVREGDRVQSGDILAQISNDEARIAVEAARLQYEVAQTEAKNDVTLRYAQKSLEVAEAELRRSTDSIERFARSVSDSQLDVERLTVEQLRLESEQAEHDTDILRLEMETKANELSAAELELAQRQVLAPIDGVIVQVFVREGEWVQPGQKAVRVVNVETLKAEGFIRADMARIDLPGAAVRLVVPLPDDPQATFAGKIVFVSPEIDPITRQVRVWADIDNRDGRLRPGQNARMTIEPPELLSNSSE